MRVAVLGDIHGNFDALSAVLSEIDSEGIEAIFCVGDIVGYGAEPSECLAEVRGREIPTVAGNHDYAVVGHVSHEYFNPEAGETVLWTLSVLSDDDKAFLSDLPLVFEHEDFSLVHSTLVNPGSFDYILTVADAAASFDALRKRCAFFGHSHIAGAFFREDKTVVPVEEAQFTLPTDGKALVNVGSVGQPRDGNPAAAYAVCDPESGLVEIRRVPYDVDTASRKIVEAGLPRVNAYRLFLGR